VALITINRPEALNSWTGALEHEMVAAMKQCAQDDAIRVVVLTGAGDKAFCAGADLSAGNPFRAGADLASDSAPRKSDGSLGMDILPCEVPKPVIAAINGHAVGVGITYAMLADVRFVSETAKIAFVFVRRGLVPELASHQMVLKCCGMSNAAELLLSGKTITGKEAAAMGLAGHALPQAEVLPAAMKLAREMALNTSPAAVAASKKFLWEDIDVHTKDRRENRVLFWLGKQPDATEGITSFIEKRAPKWTSKAGQVPAEISK
jgi:enoyl-CoA hydratase/carnithine racemase